MSKVLIVGAGLGGLVLAQVLRNNHVPFEIFERDQAPVSRKQGWAVALVECIPSLEKHLPPTAAKNLHTNSVNYLTGDHDEVTFIDPFTGEKVGAVGGVGQGQKGHILRVGRLGFRNYLLEADNLPVSWGKRFTHYTQESNKVTAFFDDGSSAEGSILVGADGAHSHVLDQLIGASHHKPTLSENVPIFGEVLLPKALYEPLRKLSSAVILTGAPNVRAQIGMLHMEEDLSSAYYFWTIALQRDDPKPLQDWLTNATKKEVLDLALEATKDWQPAFRDMIIHGGADGIVKPQPQFIEYVPPDSLPSGRVTILGDAAHAMVPFRGAGANTAILDACDLGHLLAKAWEQKHDFVEVLDPYHKVMLPRGQNNVLSSRAAGHGKDGPMHEWSEAFKKRGE